MIQFSIPAAIGMIGATGALAVASVAVAVPILQADQVAQKETTQTASPTPTPTPTKAAVATTGGDSPLSAWSNHEIGNGVSLHDLTVGFNVIRTGSGVIFSYVGPCQGVAPSITVWGNNGQVKMSGGGGACPADGGITFSAKGLTWNEDIRNSYCYSPLGGASAYRAEVYGMYTEWVSIPDEYKQCINGQAPEGPLPPGEVSPVTPPAPVETAPAPSSTESSAPSPSVSSSP